MEHVRTVTREFVTGEKAVLHLEARSGSVIVEGRESDRVVVDAVIHVWTDLSAEADDAAAIVERNMEQDAHRVIVRAPSLRTDEARGLFAMVGMRSSRIEYRVRVPVRTAVRVLSRSGAVQVAHVEGLVHTEAMSGKVGVEDVRGDVTARTRSGVLMVERVAGNVSADARSGKVRLREISGNVEVEARSGSMEIEGIGGGLRLSSSAGSVTVSHVAGKLHARSRAGSFRYRGRVCDHMDIEAHAGSITLAVDPDYPFFLDAESHHGSVRSDLPPRRSGAAPSDGGPKVKLRSRAGSIRLTRLD
jgi:DUF4097 and DUF4098 domain-containing protein YvlB